MVTAEAPARPTPTLNPVRETARDVLATTDCVTINHDAIDAFVAAQQLDALSTPTWDAPVFPATVAAPDTPFGTPPLSIEATLRYIVVGNALNYCFRTPAGDRFAATYDGVEYTGAFGLWACLTRALEDPTAPDLLDGATLESLSATTVRDVFAPSNGVALPLAQTRVRQLRAVGRWLTATETPVRERFAAVDWQAYQPCRDDDTDPPHPPLETHPRCAADAVTGIVPLLVTSCDAYRSDVWHYTGDRPVRFDKRAQLAVSMLAGRLQSVTDAPTVGATDELTVFADYGLPALFRATGILSYDAPLLAAVTDGEPVPAGSTAELAIRAATVVAGDAVWDALATAVPETELGLPTVDAFLWSQYRDTETTPHYTATTAY